MHLLETFRKCNHNSHSATHISRCIPPCVERHLKILDFSNVSIFLRARSLCDRTSLLAHIRNEDALSPPSPWHLGPSAEQGPV